MRRSFLWGVLAGAAYALLATRPARVRVSESLEAAPEDLLRAVAEVEREPEWIPFVEVVRVEDRERGAAFGEPSDGSDADTEDHGGETVRYRVETRVAGLPGWARFHKRIDPSEGRAEWRTLDGMLGFRQRGRLVCERRSDCTFASIRATTRFQAPLLGPLLAHLSRPFLAYAFSAWLRNLDAAVRSAPE